MTSSPPPSVVILDYGSGNLRSAERALTRVGAKVTVTSDLGMAANAEGLVVPGVGAFAACMQGINALVDSGGYTATQMLTERVAAARPVLGICVGMQILFERGDEHGFISSGLGLLPGVVQRLGAKRLPHMGWNTVLAPEDSSLFAGIAADERFYFVHSYGIANTAGIVSVTEHEGFKFIAAIETGVLSATQFHPEKSGDSGAALLANWVASLR